MSWMTVCLVFLSLYALLLFYYRHYWRKLPLYVPGAIGDRRFISVIVAARNEAATLPALLKALSEQSYPEAFFEIIIVDDFSSDNTAQVARELGPGNLSLIVPDVPSANSSKKRAIEAGIRMAKGELIVTTDADCVPGKNWLDVLNDFYVRNDAVFIAAPVRFSHRPTLLQLFQAVDFLTLQGITAASVSARLHAMCNGANLAYTKKAFAEVGGFEGIDHVATGDDMLLMHKIWKRYPDRIFYIRSREVIVTTRPMATWKEFFMQRKRWASKTLVYDDHRIIAVLVFVYLLNCLFIALIVAALVSSRYWWYVAGFCVVKALIELPFVSGVARFYDERPLVNYLFLFQPLHMLYTVVVGLLSQFGRYEWKGRKTK